MNKFAIAAALAALSLPAVASAQRIGPAVVALVDTARIYRECTACVAAQGQLQTQVNALRTRAQTLEQGLQREATPVQTAVNALAGKQPDAALATRIRGIQTKQDGINQELNRGEQNIRSIQANVQQQINAQLLPIITTVMGTRGANIAMDKSASISSAPALDITNEVLTQLNARLPSVNVTPLPQQAQPQQPAGR